MTIVTYKNYYIYVDNVDNIENHQHYFILSCFNEHDYNRIMNSRSAAKYYIDNVKVSKNPKYVIVGSYTETVNSLYVEKIYTSEQFKNIESLL